jgi:hypothetical protein
MPNVFFDTNFYIDLGKSDEWEAIIDGLNRLDVAPVITSTLVFELLRSSSHQDNNHRIVTRLGFLNQPPVSPFEFDSFDFLLLDPEDFTEARPKVEIHDKIATYVRSDHFSSPVDSPVDFSLDPVEVLNKVMASFNTELPKIFSSMGIDFQEHEKEEMLKYIQSILGQLAPLLEEMKSKGGSSEEMIEKYLLQTPIAQHLGKDKFLSIIRFGEQQDEVDEVLLGSDDRGRRLHKSVESGTEINQKTFGKLRSTQRDSTHINDFIEYHELIDYFQMDKKQYKFMENRENHPLKKRGLADRAFHEKGMRVVERLEEMILKD